MDGETERLPLPRTVLLMDYLIRRLRLRAVPPFTFNAGLALVAVGGGLLLPQWFGRLAGSLLEMQCLAIITLAWLLIMLIARQVQFLEQRRNNRNPEAFRSDLRFTAWFFDFPFLIALLLSIKIGGPFGPLELTFLAGAAVIGGAGEEHDAREIAELGARLLVGAVALVLAAWAFGLPRDQNNWPGAAGSIAAAGTLFGALALSEAAGIYPRLADRILRIAARMLSR